MIALLPSLKAPYPLRMQEYAKECCRLETEYREEAEEAVGLMEIQNMLLVYGVKQFRLQTRSTTRIISHILAQTQNPRALQDSMLLVGACQHWTRNRAI